MAESCETKRLPLFLGMFLKLLCLSHVLCVYPGQWKHNSRSDIYFYQWVTRCLFTTWEENPFAYSGPERHTQDDQL